MSGKSARTLGEELYYLDKSRERCLKRLTNKIARKINCDIRLNVKIRYHYPDILVFSFKNVPIYEDYTKEYYKKHFCDICQLNEKYVTVEIHENVSLIFVFVELKGYRDYW